MYISQSSDLFFSAAFERNRWYNEIIPALGVSRGFKNPAGGFKSRSGGFNCQKSAEINAIPDYFGSQDFSGFSYMLVSRRIVGTIKLRGKTHWKTARSKSLTAFGSTQIHDTLWAFRLAKIFYSKEERYKRMLKSWMDNLKTPLRTLPKEIVFWQQWFPTMLSRSLCV